MAPEDACHILITCANETRATALAGSLKVIARTRSYRCHVFAEVARDAKELCLPTMIECPLRVPDLTDGMRWCMALTLLGASLEHIVCALRAMGASERASFLEAAARMVTHQGDVVVANDRRYDVKTTCRKPIPRHPRNFR